MSESANVGRYQAVEASSGTLVRMNLMDSPQSISVVTSEFMQDSGQPASPMRSNMWQALAMRVCIPK